MNTLHETSQKSLQEWTWKKLAGLKVLNVAQHERKMDRRSRLNDRLAIIQQNLYAKKAGVTNPPPPTAEDDVQVGDNEVHYHDSSTASKWAPVIGAALLGLGITAGVLGAKALMPGQDIDTQYNLGGEWVESQPE